MELLKYQRIRLGAAEQRAIDLSGQLGKLPERAVAFTRLEQRVEAVQSIYNRLLDRYYEAQIAEAVEAGEVGVVDDAPVPQRPDLTHKGRDLSMSLFVGLLVGVGLSLALEFFDPSVRGRSDTERAAGVTRSIDP